MLANSFGVEEPTVPKITKNVPKRRGKKVMHLVRCHYRLSSLILSSVFCILFDCIFHLRVDPDNGFVAHIEKKSLLKFSWPG